VAELVGQDRVVDAVAHAGAHLGLLHALELLREPGVAVVGGEEEIHVARVGEGALLVLHGLHEADRPDARHGRRGQHLLGEAILAAGHDPRGQLHLGVEHELLDVAVGERAQARVKRDPAENRRLDLGGQRLAAAGAEELLA